MPEPKPLDHLGYLILSASRNICWKLGGLGGLWESLVGFWPSKDFLGALVAFGREALFVFSDFLCALVGFGQLKENF